MNLPRLVVAVLLMVRTPCTRPGWFIANLVMMLAPAPSPSPTTRSTRRWSSTVTSWRPSSAMAGNRWPAGRSAAPGSCPGRQTCRKTALRLKSVMAGSETSACQPVLSAPTWWTVRQTSPACRWVSRLPCTTTTTGPHSSNSTTCRLVSGSAPTETFRSTSVLPSCWLTRRTEGSRPKPYQ